MSDDMEKIITDNVWASLKTKVKGKVFVRIYEPFGDRNGRKPYLVVKVCKGKNVYVQEFNDVYDMFYSQNVTTDDVVDLFMSGYKKKLYKNTDRLFLR